MKRVFRQSFYVGLAWLVASTAIWGQQAETEQERRPQPPSAWKKVSEKKVSLPAGTMLAVQLIDGVSTDKGQAGDRFEGTLDASRGSRSSGSEQGQFCRRPCGPGA